MLEFDDDYILKLFKSNNKHQYPTSHQEVILSLGRKDWDGDHREEIYTEQRF